MKFSFCKKNVTMRILFILISLIIIFSVTSCNRKKPNNTQSGSSSILNNDESSNIFTSSNSTGNQSDASGNKSGNSSNSNNGSTSNGNNIIPSTLTYKKPSNGYNYMKDASGLAVYYDFKGSLSDDKTSINITAAGGPMVVSNVFMDSHQSYAITCKAKATSSDSVIRIIFKGSSAFDHMYVYLSKDGIGVYDCESGLLKDNPFIAVETRKYQSDKAFNLKANQEYNVAIATSPGYLSVWIDGTQYINKLDLNNGLVSNSYYLLPDYKSTVKESRFITNKNVLGFYVTSGTAAINAIDVFYTVSGMDKNYIDDGSDTNYASTWKQNNFIVGSYISYYHTETASPTAGINLLKNANVNLILPVQFTDDTLETYMRECQNAGVDFFASSELFTNATMVDDNGIKSFVNKVKGYTHLYGYYIADEPVTNSFWKVRRMSQLFTKYDSGRLTFSCLLPSYSDTYTWTADKTENKYNTYIDTFMSKAKPSVLSNDFYPFQEYGQNINMKTNQLWRDMGYLRKSSIKNSTKYWQVISGVSNWNTSEVGYMNPERIKIAMNSSIAYGATGVLYFTGHEAIITSKSTSGKVEKSANYDALTILNKQSQNIGNLLLNATSTAVYHSDLSATQTSLYFLDSVSKSSVISSLPSASSLIVGEFTVGSKTYLAIVNKDYTASTTATIALKNTYRVSQFNANSNAMGPEASSASIIATIEAGGIQVFQLV